MLQILMILEKMLDFDDFGACCRIFMIMEEGAGFCMILEEGATKFCMILKKMLKILHDFEEDA